MIDTLAVLARGIGTTLGLTALSFVMGAVLAIPIVLLRRSRSRLLRIVGSTVVEVVRSMPPLVWLFLIYYGVGSDIIRLDTFQAAIAGFSIISAVYLAEVYRAAIEAIPHGQFEAAQSLAMGPVATALRITVPQAALLTVPPAAGYAIALLKDTAAASIIGATDITFLANQTARTTGDQLTPFLVAAGLYLVLSVPIAIVARASTHWIEQKLRTT